MSTRLTFFASTALVSLGLAGVSIAQSGPFDAPPPPGTAPQARPYSPPAPAAAPAPQPYSAPIYNAPAYSAPAASQPAAIPSAQPAPYSETYPAPAPSYPESPATLAGGVYYPPADPAMSSGIQYGGATAPRNSPQFYRGPAFTDPNYNPGSYDNSAAGSYGTSYQSASAPPQGRPQAGPMTGGPMAGGPYTGGPLESGPYGGPQTRPQGAPQKRSFLDRIGLGKLRLKTDGFLRLGNAFVSGVNNDGTDNDRNELVFDGMARGEVSAITSGGLEYGVSLKLRGQRDRLREGFGGLAGDCPPGFADCATVLVAGTPRAVRGHTGQLYNYARNDAVEHALQLEGAHLFLRSAYGDITLGRDDGSAALFSGSAPSTLPLARASNARTDYTGLDMTKTLNDASGFAEKITYTSPRLLGDQIGFGVQLGVSYAPKTEICGVDYCVRGNNLADPLSPLSPSLEDAFELGLALDRTFSNGLSVEGTLSYATASETTGFTAFDDLQSWGTGLNIGWGDFEFGTNYLLSNNGIADDGDYAAFDAGLSWKPAKWGVSLGYGQSKDDLAKAEGRSLVLGGSYDWTEAFTLGTGVQYSEREVPVQNGTLVDSRTDDAVALFIEGGFKF